MLQRKLESVKAAYNQHNIEVLINFYKQSSKLDLLYKIVRTFDLKELKEFIVTGDKLEAPKPVKLLK